VAVATADRHYVMPLGLLPRTFGLKHLLIMACLMTMVGCTYRPIRGTWTGPLTSVAMFDRHGREHRVVGFDAERGTRIDQPYALAGVAHTILVDEECRPYPPDTLREEPGAIVSVRGTMKVAAVRAMDCGAYLGNEAWPNSRSSSPGGALVIIVHRANVQRTDFGSRDNPPLERTDRER
jgi:hypothetical protein